MTGSLILPATCPVSPDSAGACDLVTKSMATFPDNIDVQHAACVAVGNLANRDAENKKRLGSAGACNKVGRTVFHLFFMPD